MKLRLDVMEKDRKTLRRDYLSISLFAGIIIITIIHFYIGIFGVSNKLNKVTKIKKDLKLELARKSGYKAKLLNLNSQKNSLESKVKFINSIISKERFSWFNFFQKLEDITPKKVWIKDLKFENGYYKIIGEGKTVFEITKMLRSMQKLNCFLDIYLHKTKIIEVEDIKLTEFEITFRL